MNTYIKIGDKIKVTVGDFTATGRVESAIDWGDEVITDWYIEFRDDEDHKIRYVKERYDHAVIIRLN